MIVHKFGGTSVRDAERFASVADTVIEHHNDSGGVAAGETVVVVSAMSGVTGQLIAGARTAAEGKDTVYREIKAGLLSRHLAVVETLLHQNLERLEVGGLIEDRLHELERLYRSIGVLGELTVRGRDHVASLGEHLSANILAAVLRERDVRAQAVSATKLIVTDDSFGAAVPLMEQTRQCLRQRVKPLVERGVIPIVTGYVAATENGVTTTLGRGGSDYSAAIIGAGLDADEVWIWSDVDGILTADPNIVPQARTLAELSYAEAADLAYFGAATPLMEPTHQRLQQRVKPLVERGVIAVVTGYVGATEGGVTTTLGRGGSDYSAAIIGVGLDADEVWIWSDVDGILTADPNIVPQARTLAELSYAEAADLAYFGADVLHPKTIRPVVESGIPLRILNSFNPSHPGTLIVETPSPERKPLPAIISTTGLSLIAVGSQDDSWTLRMAARALQRLSEAGLEVLMFSQSLSEHSLNLVLREQDQAHCLQILRRQFADGVCNLGTKEKVATISVVGVPGWNETGVVPHAFSALGKHNTRVIAVAQAATEHSVSFCIPEEQVADTVRLLHHELGLDG